MPVANCVTITKVFLQCVSSPGAYDTNVTYSMTTINGGGMVQVDDCVITATSLSYTIINVTSVSSFCIYRSTDKHIVQWHLECNR